MERELERLEALDEVLEPCVDRTEGYKGWGGNRMGLRREGCRGEVWSSLLPGVGGEHQLHKRLILPPSAHTCPC